MTYKIVNNIDYSDNTLSRSRRRDDELNNTGGCICRVNMCIVPTLIFTN